jgi:hypothetical protein
VRTVLEDDQAIVEGGRGQQIQVDVAVQRGEGGFDSRHGQDLREDDQSQPVDQLAISTAPLVLGGGKRLFDGFERDIDLEVRGVSTSPHATHVRYTVRR